MIRNLLPTRFLALLVVLCFGSTVLPGAIPRTRQSSVRPLSSSKKAIKAKKPGVRLAKSTSRRSKTSALRAKRTGLKSSYRKASYKSKRSRRSRNLRYVAGGPWLEPTFADSTFGDNVDGEDLTVRRAAVEALGPYNGSVVVADPQTGRLLTVVNQKVAFRHGFQPCSTIKIVAAVAGLAEGLIDRDTYMHLYGRTSWNLTDALAKSNNPYFANIGVKLGYHKIAYYSRLMGLGEKAGWNITEELAGTIPDAPPKNGGMGMMTSFGEGIKLTPLQLTGVLSAVANGGTLYYLQYPRSQAEIDNFMPRVKRKLGVQESLPELRPGLLGATEYGTAQRAAYDSNEPVFGKTGTCTDRATPTHLGWFGSFNEVAGRRLAVVVLLTGGRPVNGPLAAGIAGSVYRNLSQQKYFAHARSIAPLALTSGAAR